MPTSALLISATNVGLKWMSKPPMVSAAREVQVTNLDTQLSMTSVRYHWHLPRYPLLWSILAYV